MLAGSSGGVPAYWDSEQRVSFIPGVVSGSAEDISETGWIIGRGTFADGSTASFIWRPGWAHVRVLGERFPGVVSVNNAGYAVGEVGGRAGVWAPTGEFEAIPLPDSVVGSTPAEINDAGQVVGSAFIFDFPRGGARRAAFVWTKGQPLTLMDPNLFRVDAWATDIDRHGRVYGVLRGDLAYWSAVVWHNGILLSNLPGLAPNTHLVDVNDCGVGVGYATGYGGPPLTTLLWLTEC